MWPTNPYDVKSVVDVRQEEAERRIQHASLLREAAQGRRRWVPQRLCPALCWVGRLLVAAGRGLYELGAPDELLGEAPVVARPTFNT